jgi:ribosomal protein S18 acetylase RimI-like enzyme
LNVSQVTEVTDEVVDAIVGLVPQLSRSAPPPSRAAIDEMVTSPATVLFVARDDHGVIIGTATLAIFRIPTGVRAWIEDVIVDQAAQRQGAATALTTAALQHAAAAGARTVELTSRPAREGANRLYLHLGFAVRDTNVYRITLDEPVPAEG